MPTERNVIKMSKLYSLYKNLKEKDSKMIYLFKNGIFYIALSDDAIYLSNRFNFKLTKLNDSVIKCGFPISSIDKYIKTFTNENVNFKIIDTSNNKIYSPQEFVLNSNINNIIKKIISIDTKQLSISEAYQFIEDLKEETNKLEI